MATFRLFSLYVVTTIGIVRAIPAACTVTSASGGEVMCASDAKDSASKLGPPAKDASLLQIPRDPFPELSKVDKLQKETPAQLNQETADTWLQNEEGRAQCGPYINCGRCCEERREGWDGEERREGFDEGWGLACAHGYQRRGNDCVRRPPIHCSGVWSAWASCSKPCGGGTQSRSFTVHQAPLFGGSGCPSSPQTQACNTHPCPVHCEGSFGPWGDCSKTCGGGTMSRTFTTTTEAAHGGDDCPASPETESCNSQPCPVDCVGSFGAWGTCSSICGGGTQERNFTVTIPPANDGKPCPDAQVQDCNTQTCPSPAPDHKASEGADCKPWCQADLNFCEGACATCTHCKGKAQVTTPSRVQTTAAPEAKAQDHCADSCRDSDAEDICALNECSECPPCRR